MSHGTLPNGPLLPVETLESRALLAISVMKSVPINAPNSDFWVVMADKGDDVYVQRQANSTYLIANNSSFINNPGSPVATPTFSLQPIAGTVVSTVLSNGNGQPNSQNPVTISSLRLTLTTASNFGGTNSWALDGQADGTIAITPAQGNDPNDPDAVSVILNFVPGNTSSTSGTNTLAVTFSSSPTNPAFTGTFSQGVPQQSSTFDSPGSNWYFTNGTPASVFGLAPQLTATSNFTLSPPGSPPGDIIAGSLGGSLSATVAGNTYSWTMSSNAAGVVTFTNAIGNPPWTPSNGQLSFNATTQVWSVSVPWGTTVPDTATMAPTYRYAQLLAPAPAGPTATFPSDNDKPNFSFATPHNAPVVWSKFEATATVNQAATPTTKNSWTLTGNPNGSIKVAAAAGNAGGPTLPSATPKAPGSDITLNFAQAVDTLSPELSGITLYYERQFTNVLVRPNSSASPLFQLPTIGNDGGVIAGTFSGTLSMAGYAGAISFYAPPGEGVVPLSWAYINNWNGPLVVGTPFIDTITGEVFFTFNPTPATPITATTLSAQWGYYNDNDNGTGGYVYGPTQLVFPAGQTIPERIRADLLIPNSTISVRSEIDVTATTPWTWWDSGIDLRATNVEVAARLDAGGNNMFIASSRRGSWFTNPTNYKKAESESIKIDAPVGAGSYDIFVTDDPRTPSVPQGALVVGPTGSLVGPNASGQSAYVNLTATDSNVFVEGAIDALQQTYLIQSQRGSETFSLSTVSKTTGLNTGRIRGGTVAVTYGTLGGTPASPNIFDVQTDVQRLRVTAAAANAASEAFPVRIAVDEANDLELDASINSTAPIAVTTKGKLTTLAAIVTSNDVALESGGTFTSNSPISTTNGVISLVADAVTIATTVTAGALYVLPDVDVASTGNVVIADGWSPGGNAIAIDGIPVTAGMRILLKEQTAAAQNGVYLAATGGNLVRAQDADAAAELPTGSFVRVLQGTTNSGTGWSLMTQGLIVLNTTNLLFAQSQKKSVTVATTTDIPMTAYVASALASSVANRATAARAATTAALSADYDGANGTLTSNGAPAALTVDGVALQVDDRVLVKDQAIAAHNGIYVVTTVGSGAMNWVLTRADDAANETELLSGFGLSIFEGTENIGTAWELRTTATVGNGNLTFDRQDKNEVRVATTTALLAIYNAGTARLTSDGPQGALSIDGVTLQATDRVLVKDQEDAAHNGIYVVTNVGSNATNWVLTRAADLPAGSPVVGGFGTTVTAGVENTGTTWLNMVGGTVGEGPLSFTQPQPVRLATTEFLNADATGIEGMDMLTNAGADERLVIDGFAVEDGDRILVKNQLDPLQNGIYVVLNAGAADSMWSLMRADDAPSGVALPAGSGTTVTSGIANGGTSWVLSQRGTAGYDPLPFVASPVLRPAGSQLVLQVDGITLAQAAQARPADRLLVKNQSDARQNGIYAVKQVSNVTKQVTDVRLATTTALLPSVYANNTPGTTASTLTANAFGQLVIDGINAVVGDRVLVKNQATAAQNGIYTVTRAGGAAQTWRLTRSADADQGLEIINGLGVYTADGVLNAGRGFVITGLAGPVTIGTTGISWSRATPWEIERAADADTAEEMPYGFYVVSTNGSTNATKGWAFGSLGEISLGASQLNFYAAAGPLTSGNGNVLLQARNGALSINAAVQAAGDTITLKASGAIGGPSRLVAAEAVIESGATVDVGLSVAEVQAQASGAIKLANTGAVNLVDVRTLVAGAITVTASGPLVATNVVASGASATPGSISLTSTLSNVTARNVVTSLGNVKLIADEGTITIDGRVQALGNGGTVDGNVLLSSANGGIVLTSAADLSATKTLEVYAPNGTADIDAAAEIAAAQLKWTGQLGGQNGLPLGLGTYGTLEINRTDAGDIDIDRGTSSLTVAGATTVDGSISLKAASLTVTGPITAGDKNSSLDHDVTLTATATNLPIDSAITAPRDIKLNADFGRITGQAGPTASTGLLAAGRTLQIRAASNAVATTTIKSLDAILTATGAKLVVTETDDLIVLRANLTGGGTGSISLTAGSGAAPGAVTVDDAINAGAAGSVTVLAFGKLANTKTNAVADIVARTAILTSKTGNISLETDVDILDASAPQAGRMITITDLGTSGLELRNVADSQANVTITAAGTITATNVKTTGGDVILTANGATSDIALKSVTAQGTVSLTAGRSILDADSDLDISSAAAVLTAMSGSITAQTAITSLAAQANGNITITDTDGIALGSSTTIVKSTAGSITVNAAGSITAEKVEASGGSVTLTTTVGDIGIGTITGLTSKQATATATVGAGGGITAINITDGGAGYGTTPPQVTIGPPGVGGTQATVDATVAASAVNGTQNLVGGSGYTVAPTVIIAPPPLGVITLTAAGSVTDLANTAAVDLQANQVVLTATSGQIRANLNVEHAKGSAGGAITLTDASGLVVDGLTSTTESISIDVKGSLSQTATGAVITGTDKVLTLLGDGTGKIDLTASANKIGGLTARNGNSDVAIKDTQGDLVLGAIQARTLTITAAGAITQVGYTLSTSWGGVVEAITIDVTGNGTAAIMLDTQNNKIGTFEANAGSGDVAVRDVDAGLILEAIKGGTVAITSTGNGEITQAASKVIEATVLRVTGNGAAAVAFDGNNKVGTFAATNAGQAITFKDADGSLALGAITGNTVAITVAGGIDQVGNTKATPWGGILNAMTLTVTGNGTAPISLGSQNNTIGTFRAANVANPLRSDVAIRDVEGGLILDNITGANVTVVSLGTGAITQAVGSVIKASAALNVTGNTFAAITLGNDNEASTFSTTNGTQAITFVNKTGALALGGITGGVVTLTNKDGGISQVASTVIQATTLDVTGDGSNAIVVVNPGNKVGTFQAANTKAGTAGANVSFTDSDGSLTVNSVVGRNITVTADGTLTVAQPVTAGTAAGGDGDIYLTSVTGDIAVNASLTAKLDRITLDAKQGTIAQLAGTVIDCQTLVWYAKTQPTFETANTNTIEGINLTVGSLTRDFGNRDVTIAGASAPDGVNVTAKSVKIIDTFTVLNGSKSIAVTATGGAITFAQAGNVLNPNGNVTLAAATSIIDNRAGVDLTAQTAALTASSGGIDLDLAVDSVTASATGNVDLSDTNGITLTSVASSAGNIAVTAAGPLTATAVSATTGHVNLSTSNGNITVGSVSASTSAGTATLTAAAGITDANAGTVNVTAKNAAITASSGGIDLDLAVDSVSATATGNVDLSDTNGITLTSVASSAGNVAVTAAGLVTATAVSASAGNVNLSTSSGSIAIGTVAASTTSGTATINAAAGITDSNGNAVNVTTKNVTLAVINGGIDLDLTVDNVTATAKGNIDLSDTNGITLTSVTSSAGNVTVATSSGKIAVGTVVSDSKEGRVTLTADRAITDLNGNTTNIFAFAAVLTTKNSGVDVDLAVDEVSVDAYGAINLSDEDGVILTKVISNYGNVVTVAAGQLKATQVSAATGRVSLSTSSGDIEVGTVNASMAAGLATLVAAGAITDINNNATNITAKTASLSARAGGVNLDLAVASVAATAKSDIDLSDTNGVTLTNVSSPANINITAGGKIAVSRLVGTGNVTLASKGGLDVGPTSNALLQSTKTLDLTGIVGTISVRQAGRILGNPTRLPQGTNIQVGDSVTSATGLSSAIQMANSMPQQPGLTYEIVVSSGFTLTQPLDVINRPLILRGISESVTLSGSPEVRNGLLLGAGASGSRITSLAFSGFVEDAIRLTNVQLATIQGIRILNSTNGISVNGTSTGTRIQGNRLDRNATGIRLDAATGVLIGGPRAGEENVISNATREGVFATGFCTGSQVVRTIFSNTQTPYNIRASRNLRIIN